MANSYINSSLLDKAIIFATTAHSGTERRGKGFPYIIHPLEAAAIVATISNDQELLAAAVLHDVVEDTPVTVEEVEELFGHRVASLVAVESDIVVEGKDETESWHERKQAAMERLAAADMDAKVVAMGDKLSNMRAIHEDWLRMGDEIWNRFHVKDKAAHEWHYRGLAASLADLSDTSAYKEFVGLIDKTFKNE